MNNRTYSEIYYEKQNLNKNWILLRIFYFIINFQIYLDLERIKKMGLIQN